ncbi:MAG: hypothetical protein OJF62_000195 [Pseudolabrys sp.]|nr:hypothetical protein [Pseudolabrys sp.]
MLTRCLQMQVSVTGQGYSSGAAGGNRCGSCLRPLTCAVRVVYT